MSDQEDPNSTVSFSGSAGRFSIKRPHAKGGLGEVYVAEDTELHRDVALKQIQQHHADEPQSRQRFMLEAEITASLEHPGIVPVYGLGRYDDGRPYYAMRLIQGDSLKEAVKRFYEDQRDSKLAFASVDFRGLLGRFVAVCNAIEYAHSRGILHRDLKPGNIMLGKYGETLVVDWGLAKVRPPKEAESLAAEPALRPTALSNSEPTLKGSAIGTPAYMSPEQASGRLDLHTAASDVYSLGATLYFVVTGKPPVAETFSQQGVIDVGAMLRKVQNGDFRRPRQVNRHIPPALESICLKAMALEPRDRHPSAKALANDLEHYLADEPVQCHLDSPVVKAGRWVRRHRTKAASLAVGAMTALAALIIGIVLIARHGQELNHKNRELDAKNQELTAANQRERTAKEQVYQTMIDAAEAHLHRAEVTGDLGTKRDAILVYLRAIEVQDLLLEQSPNDPRLLEQLAGSYHSLGNMQSSVGDLAKALASRQTSHELRERIAREHPDRPKAQSLLAVSLMALGGVHNAAGRASEAEPLLREAQRKLEKCISADPLDRDSRGLLSGVLQTLSNVAIDRGEPADAVEMCAQARGILAALIEQTPGMSADYSALAQVCNTQAIALKRLDRLDEAEAAYRVGEKALQEIIERHPEERSYRNLLAMIDNNLARLLISRGKHRESVERYQQAIDQRNILHLMDPTDITFAGGLAENLVNLAGVQQQLGEIDEALAACEKATKLLEPFSQAGTLAPEARSRLSRSHAEIAELLLLLGRFEDSAASYRQAIQAMTQLVNEVPEDAGHALTLAAQHGNLGHVLFEQGRNDEALAEYEKAYQIQSAVPKGTLTDRQRRGLATTAESMGRLIISTEYERGWGLLEEAQSIRQEMWNADRDDLESTRLLAMSHFNLAVNAKDRDLSLQQHRQARDLRKRLVERVADDVSQQFELGVSLLSIGSLLLTKQELSEAEAAFIEGGDYLRRAYERAPNVKNYRIWMLLHHDQMADLLAQSERFVEAVEQLNRAIELAEADQIPQLRFRRADAQARLGDHAASTDEVAGLLALSGLKPIDTYNAACIFALASGSVLKDTNLAEELRQPKSDQHATRAIELLRQAIADGFKDFKQLQIDSDLIPLRGRADFKEFLKTAP